MYSHPLSFLWRRVGGCTQAILKLISRARFGYDYYLRFFTQKIGANGVNDIGGGGGGDWGSQ